MNTQVSRPGHIIPGWEVQAYSHPSFNSACSESERVPNSIAYAPITETEREARTLAWLDRLMWCAGGMSLGALACWASILISLG